MDGDVFEASFFGNFLLAFKCCLSDGPGIAPLAAFGWVMATHLSLYPVILIIPVSLSLPYSV